MTTSSSQARAIENMWLATLGRFGWLAKGVVYIVMGVLAIPIAVRSRASGEASPGGALQEIAQTPFGSVLLLATGGGLALYSLWRLTTALLPGTPTAKSWMNRVAFLFTALVYGLLAWGAVSFVLSKVGIGKEERLSGGQSTLEQATREVMAQPAGRLMMGAAALVAVIVAGFFVINGVRRKFLEQIDLSGASGKERTILEWLGTIGWIGRGITVALLAVFVGLSALRADPRQAEGLDGALRQVSRTEWGTVLVLLAGAGLFAYGSFTLLTAHRRRLLGP